MRLDPRDQLLGVRRSLLVLDAGVEVLGVLAHDDQVDVLEAACGRRGSVLHGRTCAYMSSSLRSATFTERKPPPTGVVIGPFSATPVSRIASSTVGRQRIAAVLLHHVGAGLADVPLELDARRLENAARRLRQLGAGPVAGDQHDAVRHGLNLQTQRVESPE